MVTSHEPWTGLEPARDPRFKLKDPSQVGDYLPNDHPDHLHEFMHRQLNEELNVMEIAACNLVDFPDAEWPLRMAIARQCADEARHAIALRRLLEARGGHLGQFRISNFLFGIVIAIPSLIGRLAVSNRSFEASAIDAMQDGMNSLRQHGDAEFIGLFDNLLTDEVQHVRFANVWIKKLTQRDGPQAVLALARAVAQADAAFSDLFAGGNPIYPVAAELRREAGFSDDEIEATREFTERQTHGAEIG
jgi:uncharacterized ferritin-like protein (DUF455 family)